MLFTQAYRDSLSLSNLSRVCGARRFVCTRVRKAHADDDAARLPPYVDNGVPKTAGFRKYAQIYVFTRHRIMPNSRTRKNIKVIICENKIDATTRGISFVFTSRLFSLNRLACATPELLAPSCAQQEVRFDVLRERRAL